jgi:hypothetical protein
LASDLYKKFYVPDPILRKKLTKENSTAINEKNGLMGFVDSPKELDGLDEYFTNKVLASKLRISIILAQKITYCLRRMGAISIADKNSNELLFQVAQNSLRTRRVKTMNAQ